MKSAHMHICSLLHTIQFSKSAFKAHLGSFVPCNIDFKAHFFLSLSTMSDMDRSSEDTVSVDSQEEVNAECKNDFSEDEEDLIVRLFNLLGQRWSLIAGRIPGRTAEEIEKYWSRRLASE